VTSQPKPAHRTIKPLQVVTLRVPLAQAPAVEIWLEPLELNLVETTSLERGLALFQGFHASRRAAESTRKQLKAALLIHRTPSTRLTLRLMPGADWAESWKAHFRARRVSDRVVIKPSWESWKTRPGDCVIELDPGMSFGTGQHATTRSCLRLMDPLIARHPGSSLLDVGCGSGILSIAAARLGCHPVTAIDNDSAAVRIARDNIHHNGMTRHIRCRVADLLRMPSPGRHDIVVANVLAGILETAAPRLTKWVHPGGHLILSGILTTQYPAVRQAYRKHGYRAVRSHTDGEWTTGWFRKPIPSGIRLRDCRTVRAGAS